MQRFRPLTTRACATPENLSAGLGVVGGHRPVRPRGGVLWGEGHDLTWPPESGVRPAEAVTHALAMFTRVSPWTRGNPALLITVRWF